MTADPPAVPISDEGLAEIAKMVREHGDPSWSEHQQIAAFYAAMPMIAPILNRVLARLSAAEARAAQAEVALQPFATVGGRIDERHADDAHVGIATDCTRDEVEALNAAIDAGQLPGAIRVDIAKGHPWPQNVHSIDTLTLKHFRDAHRALTRSAPAPRMEREG